MSKWVKNEEFITSHRVRFSPRMGLLDHVAVEGYKDKLKLQKDEVDSNGAFIATITDMQLFINYMKALDWFWEVIGEPDTIKEINIEIILKLISHEIDGVTVYRAIIPFWVNGTQIETPPFTSEEEVIKHIKDMLATVE